MRLKKQQKDILKITHCS